MRPQLSSFGALYLLLDAWTTPATRHLIGCGGGDFEQGAGNADSAARRRAVLTQMAAALTAVMRSLQTAVPRSQVESHVQALLATLSMEASVPYLKVPHHLPRAPISAIVMCFVT